MGVIEIVLRQFEMKESLLDTLNNEFNSKGLKSRTFNPKARCIEEQIWKKYVTFCRDNFKINPLSFDQVRGVVGEGCSNEQLKRNLGFFYDPVNGFWMY
jgi:hypothetical protein